MRTSNLYKSLLLLQTELTNKLSLVSEYLTPGEATSTITFYNARNQVVKVNTIRSKWTTSLGKQRIKINHHSYIHFWTNKYIPGAKYAKVSSPFVKSGKRIHVVESESQVNVQVQYMNA
jgi:hypothetical protein